MVKQYKALQPVGRFAKGETVGGLDDYQIKRLLENGVIKEEVKEVVEVKASTAKKPTTGDEKDVKQA